MAIPEWNKAIDKELIKFEINSCFQFVPNSGQHLAPIQYQDRRNQEGPPCRTRGYDDPTRGFRS
jgi:hypothetical protein